jgi:hypothetical protein
MTSQDEIILLRFEERVAIMIHDGGLSECAAVRAAYADTRKQFPGIPMPFKIRFIMDKCMSLDSNNQDKHK